LAPPQHLTLGGNVRLILPGGMQAFFEKVSFSWCRNR
jgi:hypothetical protein